VPAVATVIDCVVAPFDHRYVAAGLAVRTTLPPLQNVVGPDGLIVGMGFGFTVTTVSADVMEHPFEFVTVTRYDPD
jgi:hypothetical protein